jgi:hypothetical protein
MAGEAGFVLPGFEFDSASSLFQGGGNVEIAPHDLHFPMRSARDFQGLREGRKTCTFVLRAFRKPPFPRPFLTAGDLTLSAVIARTACLKLSSSAAPHRYR